MKRALFALILTMLLVTPMAASVVTETGLSVLFGAGSEKRPIEALLYFFGQHGAPLTRSDNTVLNPGGGCVNVQVFPKGATGPTDFIIGYTTDTIMPKEPKRAEFTTSFGWCFQLSAKEVAQCDGLVRALQLKVIDRDGQKSWIRAIFKVTYGSGWVTQYDQILIKTVERSQLYSTNSGTGAGSEVLAALAALKKNDQILADRIDDNDCRLIDVEDWARSASNSSSLPGVSGQLVTLPVNFTGRFASIGMRITDQNGKVDGYVVKTTSQMLSLPSGRYAFDLLVDYGNNVVKKKKPIMVDIDAGTKFVSIDVGGGRR